MPPIKDFKHNHYVPEWYQRRFLAAGKGKYWYLDLTPDTVTKNGHTFRRRALLNWGPDSCFALDDLYTTTFGGQANVDIEKFFFGRVDGKGKKAIEFFSDFSLRDGMHEAFQALMNYMSIQKLRTPKGLGWLAGLRGGRDRNQRLMLLQTVQNIFCATWTECIWQIADASNSPTKFIISDHPVTVYNRVCFPGSELCKGFNDPDIRMAATHTYKDGKADSWDEYGRKPWQKGYQGDGCDKKESDALQRFQDEWALMQGPEYRGTSGQFHRQMHGPYVTPEEFHQEAVKRALASKNRR